MIIHSPIISGSLTFADGSTFTLPDGGNYSGSFSGSVQISEVKSHLVPDTNEEYDLGSATNRFRDVYLSNNTINFPSGSVGINPDGAFGFNDPFGAPAPIKTSVVTFPTADGGVSELKITDGQLTTQVFDPFGSLSGADLAAQLSGSFTGSFLGDLIGTVDGVDVSALNTNVDAILSGSQADKDSFAEIVTLINSVDTSNDQAFAGYVTASNDRFDSIEGFTSSIDTTIKTKLDSDGIVSSSVQVTNLLPSGVVSGSSQVIIGDTNGFTEFSSSVSDTFDGLSSNYEDLIGIPSGIISSSDQLEEDFLNHFGDGVFSGSAQVDLTQTTNYASGIKLKLDAEGVISGSSQLQSDNLIVNTLTTVSNIISTGSITANGNLNVGGNITFGPISAGGVVASPAFYITGNDTTVRGTLELGSTVSPINDVSASIASLDGFQSNIDTTIKTKLDADGVISGSSQVTITESQISDFGSYVTTNSAQSLSTAGNALTLSSNTLTLARGDGSTDTIDLSSFLDEDARAIASGTLNAGTGIVTFTRDDSSTFTLNLSALLDDTNLVTSVAGKSGVVSLVASDVGLGAGADVTFGTLRIDDATASTSTTSGALRVDGGVGIGGALNVGGDVVAYASSDKRLKDNIQNIENPIEKVQQLNGVTWDWNGNADELQQSLPNVGVIAQEVEEVFPQLVHDRDNGYKGVDYAKLTGLLIEAVKEQQKQIEELKSKLG